MYLFYGDGCPHCKQLKEFLNEYLDEKEGSKINLIGLVVSLTALSGASIYAIVFFFRNVKKLSASYNKTNTKK